MTGVESRYFLRTNGHPLPAGISNTLVLPNAGTKQVQMSVLVDVREISEKSQGIVGCSNAVVRLHTLNECKRRIGNPRKITLERFFVKRGRGVLGQANPHGKLAVLLPVGVNGGNVRISLDEIEHKVIQGGSHLVNHLASQKRYFQRRRLGDIQLLFALRLFNDFVRFSSGVSGNALLDRLQVFRCPDEFNFRRSQPTGHSRG